MINPLPYQLADSQRIETPALLFYRDIIARNTENTIQMAGGAERLWPHVKSHKMREMLLMQRSMGITRAKCATIAEAQMAAECGTEHVLLAYPLIGPNIGRFIQLQQAYPACTLYAIGDDEGQLALLSQASCEAGITTRVLLDVDMGMHRTGVPLEKAEALYRRAAAMEGLSMAGIHAYDGHLHQPALADREKATREATAQVHALRQGLAADGVPCALLVVAGTPSFPVHARYEGVFLSPGTIFLGDIMCYLHTAELPIMPGVGILTRVVSRPAARWFTVDVGCKGISTDQAEGRGILVGMEDARAVSQSEEHWVFEAAEGARVPEIGEALVVLPYHVCPAVALYPFAHVVEDGRVVGRWEVAARNRNIGI